MYSIAITIIAVVFAVGYLNRTAMKNVPLWTRALICFIAGIVFGWFI